MRQHVTSLVIAATAAGALAFTTTPASASVTPWKPAPTSNTTCGELKWHGGGPGTRFTTCVLYKDGYAQAVLLASSFGIRPHTVNAGKVDSTFGSAARCATTTIGPGMAPVACVGPKVAVSAAPTQLPTATLTVNGVAQSYP
ncbi:hypothetical protein [Streptomyces sp. NPDC048057]|uniref:hypothetical protein n=1 Tax=Streptomyces sp. NPDC048057 TaxID=3155628 RepID=UPI0033DC8693